VQKIDPFVTTLTGSPEEAGQASSDFSATFLSLVGDKDRKARVSKPRVEMQAAATEVALRLRVAPGSQVISRHQQRFIDELPWSLQTSFYPMEFVTVHGATNLLIAEDIADGTVHYLEQVMRAKQIEFRQIGYRDWITARNPDDNEQSFFQISHDATVFEIFRTGFDQDGKPMRVTVTVYPADRNQFLVDVGDIPNPVYNLSAKPD
jgi:GntR family transcriptional regulator